MSLFYETENKFYELISTLINQKKSFTEQELTEMMQQQGSGEVDFEVVDALFSKELGQAAIFSYEDDRYVPLIQNKMPIRNTKIELQAAKALITSQYAKQFLSESTLIKLQKATAKIETDWDLKAILIKNQFSHDTTQAFEAYANALRIIATAIKENSAIEYDSVKPGAFEYIGAKAFPVKIEYSFVNDMFRISAFEPKEERFIKMNLINMSNIRKETTVCNTLASRYDKFLKSNKKKVVLDVEPIEHVIERCFRIFSFYDRKAVYDREANIYKLEISYYKYDESEVIRDILSLGSSAIVIEPKCLQSEIYQRILKASELYT